MENYAEMVARFSREEAIHRYHHLICPWRFTLVEHFRRAAALDGWIKQRELTPVP